MKIIEASTSFEDAIRRAISWGGDSDTIGAIVGSIAEALYGVPSHISHEVFNRLPSDMLEVIATFYKRLNEKSYERKRESSVSLV